MRADDTRHGEMRGYLAHRKDDEEPCASCRAAAARYEQNRQLRILAGQPLTFPGLGSARRLQALVALGWSYPLIAQRLGCNKEAARHWANGGLRMIRSTTAAKIDAVYRDLCMTPPPQRDAWERYAASRARATATRCGWVTAVAWDDIDNDPAPHIGGTPLEDEYVDPAVVERLVSYGERARRLTWAEGAEVLRRCRARGMADAQTEELYGIKPERYKEPAA